MKTVESFLGWLPTVVVKAGSLRWSGGQLNQRYAAELAFGDSAALNIQAPGLGTLNIGGDRATWTPSGRSGRAKTFRLFPA